MRNYDHTFYVDMLRGILRTLSSFRYAKEEEDGRTQKTETSNIYSRSRICDSRSEASQGYRLALSDMGKKNVDSTVHNGVQQQALKSCH